MLCGVASSTVCTPLCSTNVELNTIARNTKFMGPFLFKNSEIMSKLKRVFFFKNCRFSLFGCSLDTRQKYSMIFEQNLEIPTIVRQCIGLHNSLSSGLKTALADTPKLCSVPQISRRTKVSRYQA